MKNLAIKYKMYQGNLLSNKVNGKVRDIRKNKLDKNLKIEKKNGLLKFASDDNVTKYFM